MTPFEDEELLTRIRHIVTQHLKEQDGYTGEFSLHIEQVPLEQVDLETNYGEPAFDIADWVEAIYEIKVKKGSVVEEYPLYIGIPHPLPFLLPSNTERYIDIPWKRPAWAMETPYKRLSDDNIQAFVNFARFFTEGDTKVFYYVPNGFMEYHNTLDAGMVQLLPVYERAHLIETKYLGNSPWQHWEIRLKKRIPEEEDEDIPEEEWIR